LLFLLIRQIQPVARLPWPACYPAARRYARRIVTAELAEKRALAAEREAEEKIKLANEKKAQEKQAQEKQAEKEQAAKDRKRA